jgi:hypothetical protein
VSLTRHGGEKHIVIHNIDIETQLAERPDTDERLLTFEAQTRITSAALLFLISACSDQVATTYGLNDLLSRDTNSSM